MSEDDRRPRPRPALRRERPADPPGDRGGDRRGPDRPRRLMPHEADERGAPSVDADDGDRPRRAMRDESARGGRPPRREDLGPAYHPDDDVRRRRAPGGVRSAPEGEPDDPGRPPADRAPARRAPHGPREVSHDSRAVDDDAFDRAPDDPRPRHGERPRARPRRFRDDDPPPARDAYDPDPFAAFEDRDPYGRPGDDAAPHDADPFDPDPDERDRGETSPIGFGFEADGRPDPLDDFEDVDDAGDPRASGRDGRIAADGLPKTDPPSPRRRRKAARGRPRAPDAGEALPRSPRRRGGGWLRPVVERLPGAGRRRRAARETADGQADRRGPAFEADIVPPQSVQGSALVTVVAIMTFLACVMAGIASMVQGAAADWRGEIARELTVEVRPTDGASMAERLGQVRRIVEAAPGVASARALSGEETEALLAPWLGVDVPLDELPVPRLVAVTVDDPAALDLGRLAAAVEAVPGATLDDHRMWTDRLSDMANAVTLAVFVLMGLILAALAFSVVFATRAAMASNAETIAVLHFVGAEAGFIAREFQRHFLVLALRGGAIGGGAALAVFLALEVAGWGASATGSAAGSQAAALLGDPTVGAAGYAAVLGIVFLVALLTALTTRVAVHGHLHRLP